MSNVVQLRTRKPTGKVAYPLIVVDGFEKTGKSSKAFRLSASRFVGRTFVCELGEPTADEYSALGDYDILVHDGTYHSMMGQLRAATSVPMTDDKPNVIIFDSGTALDAMLGVWIDERARAADLRKEPGKSLLKADPDAEVKPHNALWNDKNGRFDDFVDLLRDWPGIAIVVCHGKEVTPFERGAPVPNAAKVYKVDVRQYLLKQANARIHCEGADADWKTTLEWARSTPKVAGDGSVDWDVKVPQGGLVLEHLNPLEYVVFDVLKAGREFQKSSAIKPSISDGLRVIHAKNGLIARLQNRFGDAAKEVAGEIWKAEMPAGMEAGDIVSDDQWTNLVAVADKKSAPNQVEKPAVLATANPQEPAVRNMGGCLNRLTAEEQATAIRWIRDHYKCGPMAVPSGDVAEIQAWLDQTFPPPPPFDESNERPDLVRAAKGLGDKASKEKLAQLTESMRDRGIIGPERFAKSTRALGRQVKSFGNLTGGEVDTILTFLETGEVAQPKALAAVS